MFSQEIGQPDDEKDAVVKYILATKDHTLNRLRDVDYDLKVVTDLDLAVLGRQPDQYMGYAAQVRRSCTCYICIHYRLWRYSQLCFGLTC